MSKINILDQQSLNEMLKEFDWTFYVNYYDGLS